MNNNQDKICPFALANPKLLDLSCEEALCHWWDNINQCCGVKTIINFISKATDNAKRSKLIESLEYLFIKEEDQIPK